MSIHFKSSVSCGQAAPEIAEFTGDSQHTHISFSSGQFPASLNTPGLVTPLLKKPGLNVDDYKNYRPVIICLEAYTCQTQASQSDKCKPLQNLHITSSPNYCPLQSAYRQLHSSATALVKIVGELLAAMDRGHPVTVVDQ